MKLRVKKQSTIAVEVEVEFPLFISRGDAFDSGGWYHVEMQVTLATDRLVVTEVSESDGNKWEFEIRTNMSIDNLATYLDQTQFYYQRSTREKYLEHLFRMKKAMENLDVE